VSKNKKRGKINMDITFFITQLENIVKEYNDLISKSQHDDGSDNISDTKAEEIKIRILTSIARATGKHSIYFEESKRVLEAKTYIHMHLKKLIGITNSVINDIKSGYLVGIEELVHSNIFSDFIEMAEYLLSNGYKDAAAVIAGSTLESHIKLLCDKFNVSIEYNGKIKKADTLNADLVKASAYNKIEQKSITAWLGIRNDAAHGNYTEYNSDQVKNMIIGIRDFIMRNPA
jgi:hypothetical protein